MTPYVSGFRSGFRRAVADPSDLIMRVLVLGLVITGLATLWRTAARSHSGLLAGYTDVGLVWYVVAAEVTVNALRSRMIEDIGDEIGSGAIAVAMLRPVVVAGLRMAVEAGASAARLLAMTAAGVVIGFVLDGSPPSWLALTLVPVSMALGVLANLGLSHMLGGIAFWILDARSAWFLYQKLVFLPGGMLMPLQILPTAIANVCIVLPFAAMAYVPGRIASGHVEPWLIGLQAGWAALLIVGALLVFSRGERRLRVVGG